MTILEMTAAHVEEVAAVENICFHIPWTKADFLKEIEVNDLASYFVAEDNGRIVAYAGLWHIITEGHITNIAVLPGYRQKGVGGKLLERLILFGQEKEMIGLTLEVKISNTAAQRLYTKYGFKPEGFRKKYYQDTGEDAVIMWKYFSKG